MANMKSITVMSFKHTCPSNAVSNKSALIHFTSGNFCSNLARGGLEICDGEDL